MKKLFALIGIAVIFSTSAMADNGLGLYGSYWKPSDGDDAFGPGIGISAEMIPGLNLEIRGAYFDNVLKDDNPTELEVIPLDAMLALKGPLADRLDIYGGIGFTYAFLDSNGSADSGELGFLLGGGLNFEVSENEAYYGGTAASLFVEVMYRSLDVDVTAPGATESDNIDLSGIGVNAGLMIRW